MRFDDFTALQNEASSGKLCSQNVLILFGDPWVGLMVVIKWSQDMTRPFLTNYWTFSSLEQAMDSAKVDLGY